MQASSFPESVDLLMAVAATYERIQTRTNLHPSWRVAAEQAASRHFELAIAVDQFLRSGDESGAQAALEQHDAICADLDNGCVHLMTPP